MPSKWLEPIAPRQLKLQLPSTCQQQDQGNDQKQRFDLRYEPSNHRTNQSLPQSQKSQSKQYDASYCLPDQHQSQAANTQ